MYECSDALFLAPHKYLSYFIVYTKVHTLVVLANCREPAFAFLPTPEKLSRKSHCPHGGRSKEDVARILLISNSRSVSVYVFYHVSFSADYPLSERHAVEVGV